MQNAKFKITPPASPKLKRGEKRYKSFWLKRGFTLLEMVISFGIFSVLVVAAIGITLAVSNAQIKSSNVQNILDNIRFSLELITKEMRTGNSYQLTSKCAPAGSEISFATAIGESRTYFLNSTTGTVMRAKIPITNADCNDTNKVKALTAEEVSVERLNFTELQGQTAGPADGQPRTTITMRVRSKSPKIELESSLNLQTTVVQRLRDL